MNEVGVFYWARAVERILIVLFAGLSLVLGWNLFRVHIQKDQVAELVGEKWSIRLQRVGPGIFFALFGAACLVAAIFKPAEIRSGNDPTGQKAAVPAAAGTMDAHYVYNSNQRQLIGDLRVMNTIDQVILPKAAAGEKRAVDQVREWLSERRRQAIDSTFPGWYSRYQKLSEEAVKTPAVLERLSREDRETYYRIDQLLNDTLAGR